MSEVSNIVSVVKSEGELVLTEAQKAELAIETAVVDWRISGWAAVAAMVASNLIGVFLHF